MFKTYKFRLYPDCNQQILINKTFGCSRFVYNYFLNKIKESRYIKAYDMCNELKLLEKEYEWLKEVDSSSLRCAVFNLEDAFRNFFSKRSGYPIFKSKYSKQSYRAPCIRGTYKGKHYSNIEVDLESKLIKLPKLGKVKIRGYRNLDKLPGNIVNTTIIKETTGKYYVNVLVKQKDFVKDKVKPISIVGIDLGLKDMVVTSDGEKYKNPKELEKKEKRLKRLQRKLSRQVKGKNNYQKIKLRLSRIQSKIKNSRLHNIINIVNKIVKEKDIIVSEKLRVNNMSKNHNLAKTILDASFNKICELLKWKCEIYGKYYYQVDTYFPSSKKCSHCEEKTDKTNNLSIRNWECKKCGNLNDRDINASINIMYEGIKIHYGS